MTSSLPRTAPARPDVPLALSWFVTALAVGFVGWLLFALSESGADRAVGGVLTVAAVLGAVLGAGLLARPGTARRWSIPLSAALVLLGLGAAVVLSRDGAVFASDLLLVAGPPVVGGLVTAVLARRGR